MDFLQMLKDKGLKATPQRLCTLKCLSAHTHPNIDELYEMIKAEHPSVSLATVYKNLSALIDENLVVEISTPGQKTRYDIYEKEHIHIICKHCGSISDIFSAEAKMSQYQEHLEKRLGTHLATLSIVATVPNCKNCS